MPNLPLDKKPKSAILDNEIKKIFEKICYF